VFIHELNTITRPQHVMHPHIIPVPFMCISLLLCVSACSGSGELAHADRLSDAECALVNTDVLEGQDDDVEEMPELIGGLKGIQRRISYTDEARRNRIEGRVYIQFVVNRRGVPVDFVVTQELGAGLDKVAVRAISKARFRPARRYGCPLPVKMSLPVTFRLN